MLKRAIGLLSPSYRFRSSVTGKFVSKLYAALHPRETERELVDMKDEGDLS